MNTKATTSRKEKKELSLIIGTRIRLARKKAGLSQEKLAELADVHPTYIGQLERGEKNATLESIHKISSALSIPLEKLFEKIDLLSDTVGTERNMPLECYDYLLSLPVSKQEMVVELLSLIHRFGES
ncbi:MAG: helix-turn-helix transcriptional regulator [Lachnospiraceae bacterium]|nr:helix-turn-helix transcriptional regulator [Lachnospiraceae bacterium]